ncbi:hypothetical protein JTE90_001069, partial [Oedothorax gibbosus]
MTVQHCQANNFVTTVQSNILKSKAKTVKILKKIEDLLSLPMLLVCTANFGACCSIVGKIPIEMASLRSAFCEKVDIRLLLNPAPGEVKLERGLYDAPDFILTG